MYRSIFFICLCNLLYFALHISGVSAFEKPLSKSEEEECFQKMEEGDKEARDKLIEHNLRLVAHIIKKYYSSYSDQEDLISIGTIGLIKAVESYKHDKKTRFATYASRCIENEILMFFRRSKKTNKDVYIQDPIDSDKDGNSLSLMDMMKSDENIMEEIEQKLNEERLYKIIEEKLSPREKNIIVMRYGLYNTSPKTQKEIAELEGISRSYISRIEKNVVEILKNEFEKSSF